MQRKSDTFETECKLLLKQLWVLHGAASPPIVQVFRKFLNCRSGRQLTRYRPPDLWLLGLFAEAAVIHLLEGMHVSKRTPQKPKITQVKPDF